MKLKFHSKSHRFLRKVNLHFKSLAMVLLEGDMVSKSSSYLMHNLSISVIISPFQFLSRLTLMFDKARSKGHVQLTMKRCKNFFCITLANYFTLIFLRRRKDQTRSQTWNQQVKREEILQSPRQTSLGIYFITSRRSRIHVSH